MLKGPIQRYIPHPVNTLILPDTGPPVALPILCAGAVLVDLSVPWPPE